MWNKIAALMILVTASSLLLTPFEVEGRGGGRGGGGGRSVGSARVGGGAYQGGRTMNRTPTMSRATTRPATSQVRQQIQTRPAQGRNQQFRQTAQQRPSAANRTELRNQVNQYSQNRLTQNIDRQSLTQRAQNFSDNRSGQIAQNRQLSENVSQRLQQLQPNSDRWFDRNFFDRHDIDLDYVGTGDNWWRPAAWATLASWGSWGWSTPYYYDDSGYSYPMSATESTYGYPYSSTTTTPPTQSQHAQVDRSTASTGEEWLPLGVFAVANNADGAAYTNRFIQLAVNRGGEIAGVLYNSTTDAAQDLTGMVVPNSQKAYWSMADQKDSPIASTGMYNLTEDQTPINVHFADGSDQTWTLVRLQRE